MATNAEIAAMLMAGMGSPAGLGDGSGGDVGFTQGTIISWDEATGVNTVQLGGTGGPIVSNVRVLSTSNSIMLSPTDVVGLLRFQSTYFILGRIQAPGSGAALQIRSAEVAALESTGSTTYTDLATFGPVVSNVYIGSARRCLVFINAFCRTNSTGGFVNFQVTGASTIGPLSSKSVGFQNLSTQTLGANCMGVIQLTAADGLNQGYNTFTMKYIVQLTGPGTGADFQNRRITVFPY